MKHLVRLYPKRWRERYRVEIAALLERHRISVRGVLDVLWGAVDAHLHPALAQQLLFVPTIGFRPLGTRTLLERAEAMAADTRLTILAVAAMPDRTELVVEWERIAEPEACALPATTAFPSTEIGAPPKLPPFASRADSKLTASLVGAQTTIDATSMSPSAYNSSGWALRPMIFPALPAGTRDALLYVGDGEHEWRVPFALVAGRIEAAPIAAEAERDGITIKAKALTWHDDQLIVAMEATAARPIGRIGAPAPAIPVLPSGRKFKVMPGRSFDPIVLEDDRGRRVEEIRRLHPLGKRSDPHVAGEPYAQHFDVIFGAPDVDSRSAVITVPFVEITDLGPSAIADLRDVPLELDLGAHRFRIVRADAYPGSDARHIQMAIPRSSGSPRFVRPASVHGLHGTDSSYSWSGEPHRGEPFWMETSVGDPPVVRFNGAVLRYDGPWRLEIPLPHW